MKRFFQKWMLLAFMGVTAGLCKKVPPKVAQRQNANAIVKPPLKPSKIWGNAVRPRTFDGAETDLTELKSLIDHEWHGIDVSWEKMAEIEDQLFFDGTPKIVTFLPFNPRVPASAAVDRWITQQQRRCTSLPVKCVVFLVLEKESDFPVAKRPYVSQVPIFFTLASQVQEFRFTVLEPGATNNFLGKTLLFNADSRVLFYGENESLEQKEFGQWVSYLATQAWKLKEPKKSEESLPQLVKIPNLSAVRGELSQLRTGTKTSWSREAKKWAGKQPVIVSFWAGWCYFCVKEMTQLNRMADRWKSKVKFVAINTACPDKGESKEPVLALVKKEPAIQAQYCTKSELQKQIFGENRLPALALFGATGQLEDRFFGNVLDERKYRKVIAALEKATASGVPR